MVHTARHVGVRRAIKLFLPFNIVSISISSPLLRRLHYITFFHLQHAKLAMMFAKTIFRLLTSAGLLLGVTDALQTVTSPSGVVYNCPDIETIEVAYAGSCKSPRLFTIVYGLS